MKPTDNEQKENLAPITGSANITLGEITTQATGIVYWAHELEQAIRDIGGDPESTAWDRWDVGHIFAAARLARELKAQYGEIAFRVTPAPTQTIYPVAIQSTARVLPATVTQEPRGVTIRPEPAIIKVMALSPTVIIGRSKNKGGRPGVLTTKAEQSAIELMKQRIPQEVIAGRLGVSVSTIKRVARRYRSRQP